MAESVLIAYSSVDGQTLRICRRIETLVAALGQVVTLHDLDAAGPILPTRFHRVLVAASIRYGHHRPQVLAFAQRWAAELARRPNAFISVNVVARKPGKDQASSNPYMQKFVRTSPWKPQLTQVFGGRIEYPRLKPLDRLVIRCIMGLTGGPTDPNGTFEFTDWRAVDDFARRFAYLPPPGGLPPVVPVVAEL